MKDDYILIFDWHGKLHLFNVKEDQTESKNLIFEMPDKTRELFGQLIQWLEENVEQQYWPVINPAYDPKREVRENAPFINLYEAHKQEQDIMSLISLLAYCE
ncbi:MAG: hypothetical protein RQ743_13285 [Bacteroidales bacterium]|nr:hypothetical protein [Bacteroidales bacterium]MDT8402661.1 hypothetical protein [Bacteroidales bacterium]